jgi:hypothetical protein
MIGRAIKLRERNRFFPAFNSNGGTTITIPT